MVDVDPTTSMANYGPRDTTLVDAVAEAKRIADQGMRSNPLTNAKIGSGLTEWRGNYGGSLVWIGEIGPNDPTLLDNYGEPKKQRGFVLQRDDPNRSIALAMYDFNPQPGGPLRQKVIGYDADGRIMYREGALGGRVFPDRSIPMYPDYSYIPEATGITAAAATVAWRGEAHLIGHRIHFEGLWSALGSPTVNSFVRITGVNGTVVTSNTFTAAGPSVVTHIVDLNGPLWDDANYARVEWFLWRTGTGGYFPRPRLCRNYSMSAD